MSNDHLSVGAIGDEVADLQDKLREYGFDVPPYEVERRFFGPGTREAVQKCQLEYSLKPTGVLDEATSAALRRRVRSQPKATGTEPISVGGRALASHMLASSITTISEASGADARADSEQHTVKGRIFLQHGVPASGVKLKVYARGFSGTETFLDQVDTEADGSYVLKYEPTRKWTNLEVRAGEEEISLAVTKLRGRNQEELNLLAPSQLNPPDSEFKRLTDAATTALKTLMDQPDMLKRVEQGDVSVLAAASSWQITELAPKAGWDGRALALAATAYEHAETTKIPVDALYALYRSGLPTEPRMLARVSTHTVKTAFRQAAQAGIWNPTDIDAAVTAFKGFAAAERLASRPRGTLGSVSDFVERARISERVSKKDHDAF